jgi:hypothetical protein
MFKIQNEIASLAMTPLYHSRILCHSRTIPVIPAPSSVIPAPSSVIPAPSSVIPSLTGNPGLIFFNF